MRASFALCATRPDVSAGLRRRRSDTATLRSQNGRRAAFSLEFCIKSRPSTRAGQAEDRVAITEKLGG